MSNFLNSSIGKKFLMSLSGFFLIAFLLVHLFVNSLILFDKSGHLFNQVAHFMGTNPIIKIVEPVLAIGFILHIIYAIILTLQNQMARPVKYDRQKLSGSSTWASRNMFILGTLVFVFLAIHIANFFWKMKFTGHELLEENAVGGVENAYLLVTTFFQEWYIVGLYIIGAIALGFHLSHAFWSAFQTLGFSNIKWRKRLDFLGLIYTLVVAGGFAIIPIWVFVESLL